MTLEDLERICDLAQPAVIWEAAYNSQAASEKILRFIGIARISMQGLIAVAKAAKVACSDNDLQYEDSSGNLFELDQALKCLEADLSRSGFSFSLP